jgi:hypothetical protein
MCLTIISGKDHKTPYNNKKIRWKYVFRGLAKKGEYTAPHAGMEYAAKGIWMHATDAFRDTFHGDPRYDIGFHVLITRESARQCSGSGLYTCGNERVVKVEVDGFIASGMFGGHKTETWKRMRLI